MALHEHILLRPERLGDDDGIDRVESAAFETRMEARIVRALRDERVAPMVSMVAEVRESGEVVGHILFGRAGRATRDCALPAGV